MHVSPGCCTPIHAFDFAKAVFDTNMALLLQDVAGKVEKQE